ncbi:ferrous iron transporter B [Candidatus Fermentibacteria bacterium]|nr:MAG: ferrous iron transporter B [Candidatus Fermentibacteria bacterium]PIE51905.1 MAG: ferrous iron transporter B [Candidatus Fermentibacteria bacterium]PIE53467.1 MAG: ferrous iron transporter B [Candidatus Fermentibacteria bacterium]
MEKPALNIAVVGNPNVGKTTLLNALTGSKQRVGNWPGVTVEKLEGSYRYKENLIEVTDLPGIYSFTAFSLDEAIARKYILEEKPDLVVNIVDACNLERNLFLTTQLLEMKVPVIVALNMMDLAEKRRLGIDINHLSEHLGCPVVPVTASKEKGVENLKDVIFKAGKERNISPASVSYDEILENAVKRIENEIKTVAQEKKVDARWLALRLLEGDEYAKELCAGSLPEKALSEEISTVEKHTGDEIDMVLADGRYGFIHGLTKDVVNRKHEVRRTVSDKLDSFVLNRFLGIPLFLGIMYLVFVGTINFSGPFIDFFDIFTGTIFVDGFGVLLASIGAPDLVITFLADGIGGGIQTVATFIPPIFMIFLFLSILEDSGYMARAAFVMDRFLRTVGLPGKAFIPMLVGFGCNVPAIMATRTLENNRDRMLTIMMNPFMSCGARLPVYALFVAVFFPQSGGTILFSLYAAGILLAVLTGLLFKKTMLKGEASTFVMELPPYHMPTFKGIMYHTMTRLKSFIFRAGLVIVMVVIVLSFLNSIGTDGSFGNQDSENSVLSAIGKAVVPVFTPMGIEENNWPAAVGLFTGIFAKEAVVGTLDNLYTTMVDIPEEEAEEEGFDFLGGISESFTAVKDGFADFGSSLSDPAGTGITADLEDAETAAEAVEVNLTTFDVMRSRFNGNTSAYAYLLFILIYAPCVAAIAAIYRETNLGWTILATVYLTLLAWIISTLFYNIANFGAGTSVMWVAVSLIMLVLMFWSMKIMGHKKTLKV